MFLKVYRSWFHLSKYQKGLNVENIFLTGLNISYPVWYAPKVVVKDENFIATSNFRNGITDCSYFELLKAKFNKINLAFKKIYETDVCLKNTLGGRIHNYTHKNIDGILLTMGASDKEKQLAQNDDSPYGKVLFLNLRGD